MNKIIECKLALMEKEKDFSMNDKSEGNYIIRSSAMFKPEEYLEEHYPEVVPSDEEYNLLIESSVHGMYDTLVEKSTQLHETLGIWLTLEDGTVIDNAIDLSVLEAMEQYGDGAVVPVREFAKMTLPPLDESETDQ